MKRLWLLILNPLILLFIPSFCFGEGVVQNWVTYYNGPVDGEDTPYTIAVDDSGNVYVTGDCNTDGPYSDYVTIKYDDTGDTQWIALYDGPGHQSDHALGIALDETGNIYVTGASTGDIYDDIATIKYNSNGIEQWIVRYDGPGNSADYAKAIVVDELGNVYVTGSSIGDEGKYDFVTIKYSNDGVEQWIVRYCGPTSANHSEDIVLDTLGNVYVTGSSWGEGTSRDYATVMYSPEGIEQWVARYDGPANGADYPVGIVLDNLGNTYVTGYSNGVGTGRDCATIKYDSFGEQVWVQRYNNPWDDDDHSYAIAIDINSNIYITGCSKINGVNRDYLTIKYDSEGEEQWAQTYGVPAIDGWDCSEDIAVDSLGNVYVTGFSWNADYISDIVTIKYNSDGIEEWVTRFDTPEGSWSGGEAIAINAAGNIYVTGYCANISQDYNFATIMYSTDVNIDTTQYEEFNSNAILRVSPNPSEGACMLKYSIPTCSDMRIGIYDLSGRLISTLLDSPQESGEHSLLIEGIPTGVYLCRLQVESGSSTTKFVVIQ